MRLPKYLSLKNNKKKVEINPKIKKWMFLHMITEIRLKFSIFVSKII